MVRSRFEERECQRRRSWGKDGCTILQVDGDLIFISSMRMPLSAESCVYCLEIIWNDFSLVMWALGFVRRLQI